MASTEIYTLPLPGTTAIQDIFVHDRDVSDDGTFDELGDIKTVQVSINSAGIKSTAGNSANPDISNDGRFVAFHSLATDLVTGTTGVQDIFVHDRDVRDDGTFDELGDIKTVQVSVNSAGVKATAGDSASPSISNDGRFVTFHSADNRLVDGDTNGLTDVFVHDRDVHDDTTFDESDDIGTVRTSVRTVILSSSSSGTLTTASTSSGTGGGGLCFITAAGYGSSGSFAFPLVSVILGAAIFLRWKS